MLVCVIVSLLLVAIGAIQALLAMKKTLARVKQTNARVGALNLAKGEIYGKRMNAAIAAMPALVERAHVSVAEMNGSFAELKLPEAIASLRNAAAAVKLLVSGR